MIKEWINDFKPVIPKSLVDFEEIFFIQNMDPILNTNTNIFPLSSSLKNLQINTGKKRSIKLKVAAVFSGGQAAGGHNVLAGLFDGLKKLNSQNQMYGFLNGPKGIIEENLMEITSDILKPYRNTGGFDLIGSGRDKIETEEQFIKALDTVIKFDLDGLIIIGGDDSNTNAALLAEYFLSKSCKTKVIGVPKTIDGDLQSDDIAISFGFDSATKTYSEIIGNLSIDALSSKKYTFFVKLMGRTASHIALECALKTHPNYCLIGEEIANDNKSLNDIIKEITDLIINRSCAGKDYGIILVPEGLLEFIPECKVLIQELNKILSFNNDFHISKVIEKLSENSKKTLESFPSEIQEQLFLDRDPHGNVQVSKIETEKLLIELVKIELNKRKVNIKFNPVPYFCGYEGRACYPSHFDANYCYSLGLTATLLIHSDLTGYIACIKNLSKPIIDWEITAIPLHTMIHLEVRKGKNKPVIKKALVNIQSNLFKTFKKNQEDWKMDDDYINPGPIQFFGPDKLINSYPLILDD